MFYGFTSLVLFAQIPYFNSLCYVFISVNKFIRYIEWRPSEKPSYDILKFFLPSRIYKTKTVTTFRNSLKNLIFVNSTLTATAKNQHFNNMSVFCAIVYVLHLRIHWLFSSVSCISFYLLSNHHLQSLSLNQLHSSHSSSSF